MLLDAVASPRLQLVKIPTRLGHADDRHVKPPMLHHCLQRRENLLVRQIARGAKKHKCIRMNRTHLRFLMAWPAFPGARRIETASPTAACPENQPLRAN